MPGAIITPGDFSSQARYLFDLYTGANGVTNIRALVGQIPRVTESNWLEFKSGKIREEDIKPHWSKALGSFANGGGGVVIWGIRADREGAGGVDAVQEEVPVPDVERLTHKLKEWQPPATDPPIRSVIVQPMLLPGSTTAGFVVCLIPESDTKPHRSEFGKGDVKRFYLRIGDSTQECSVPLLRQLFYPRVVLSAELEVEAGPLPINMRGMWFSEPGSQIVAHAENAVSVRVRNTGIYSIHEPVLDLECGTLRVGTIDFNVAKNEYEFSYFRGSASLPRTLHPHRVAERRFIFSFGPDQPDPRLVFTLYARDLLPLSAEIAYNEVTAEPWTKKLLPLVALA